MTPPDLDPSARDGRLNIAHEAVDRHVAAGRGERVALRWIARDGRRHDCTYGELAEASSRFAAVLAAGGLRPGEVVATLLGRCPEAVIAALGTWKAGGVFCPLLAALGPEPVRNRLRLGGARVLVATTLRYRDQVAELRAGLPRLARVLISDPAESGVPAGTEDLPALLAGAPADGAALDTAADDPAMLHFTSGSAGTPKGSLQAHGAMPVQCSGAKLALDLREGDVYWCTGEVGWITFTAYGIIAPLAAGATVVLDEAEFNTVRWYSILRDERVDVWYTTPTAIRMLMSRGAALARTFRITSLRLVATLGEPLNAEAVLWGRDAFGVKLRDTWWQTETGGIVIANATGTEIKPGSMGRPLPGFEVAVVRRTGAGAIEPVDGPDEPGELALRAGWPAMFSAYVGDAEAYDAAFADGWYLTGDLVRRDADGYFWFLGRRDEVVKSAGHTIGPAEVECALLDHPAVAEAAVVGRPDRVAHEVVKAFVSLQHGFEAGEPLRRELLAFARARLGRALAPQDIEFLDALPKTASGKILRRVLRARELPAAKEDARHPEGMAS